MPLMKHFATLQIVGAALVAFLFGPSFVTASEPSARPALKTFFEAHTDFITLADLLPADAASALRDRAVKITVTAAPFPGSHRILEHVQIEQALHSVPEIRRSLEIPASIDITRWSRLLTRGEVLAAIRQAFTKNDLPYGAAEVTAEELVFTSSISVTEDVPKLKITRIESTHDGTGTRLRLWTASEPRIPPFWVTLTHKKGGALNRVLHSDTPGESPDADSPNSVLVKTGAPVQLILLGRGMRIVTTAVPLDIGHQGQKIRVRAALNGRILTGTVTSLQTVEVQY